MNSVASKFRVGRADILPAVINAHKSFDIECMAIENDGAAIAGPGQYANGVDGHVELWRSSNETSANWFEISVPVENIGDSVHILNWKKLGLYATNVLDN